MASGKNKVAGAIGVFLGVVAGGFAFAWWKDYQKAKDNLVVDTGEKTPDGYHIVEVTGVGGADNGKKVRGYELPNKVSDLKLPLTVVIKPNRDLFLDYKIGQNIKFERVLNNDELVFIGKAGGGTEPQENIIWYPDLKDKALGAV